jgi:hypothetical protein
MGASAATTLSLTSCNGKKLASESRNRSAGKIARKK